MWSTNTWGSIWLNAESRCMCNQLKNCWFVLEKWWSNERSSSAVKVIRFEDVIHEISKLVKLACFLGNGQNICLTCDDLHCLAGSTNDQGRRQMHLLWLLQSHKTTCPTTWRGFPMFRDLLGHRNFARQSSKLKWTSDRSWKFSRKMMVQLDVSRY